MDILDKFANPKTHFHGLLLTPDPDGVYGLAVEAGPGVGLDQLEAALVQLQHEVPAPAPHTRPRVLLRGGQVHDTPAPITAQYCGSPPITTQYCDSPPIRGQYSVLTG